MRGKIAFFRYTSSQCVFIDRHFDIKLIHFLTILDIKEINMVESHMCNCTNSLVNILYIRHRNVYIYR